MKMLLFKIEYGRAGDNFAHTYEERIAAQNIHVAMHHAIDQLNTNGWERVVCVHQIDEIEIVRVVDPVDTEE